MFLSGAAFHGNKLFFREQTINRETGFCMLGPIPDHFSQTVIISETMATLIQDAYNLCYFSFSEFMNHSAESKIDLIFLLAVVPPQHCTDTNSMK